MSDSEGSSDFELVSHDGSLAGFSANATARPASRAAFGVERDQPTTRRSLTLTHSQVHHSQPQPPPTDTDYDALSESSMDDDHDLDHHSISRGFAHLQSASGPAGQGPVSFAPSSASASSLSLPSSLSHSTVSTTSTDETDTDDGYVPPGRDHLGLDGDGQQQHQEQQHITGAAFMLTMVAAPAVAADNVTDRSHGAEPFPSTFPMSVAHLPALQVHEPPNISTNEGQDQHQEQYTLPGADTDTDDEVLGKCAISARQPCGLAGDAGPPSSAQATTDHLAALNHDLVMRSRLVHHGVASTNSHRQIESGIGNLDPVLLVQVQDEQGFMEPDGPLDSVIDVSPPRSHMGTLANTSAAELPELPHVSDAPPPTSAQHSDDASTRADPNGLMDLMDGLTTHSLWEDVFAMEPSTTTAAVEAQAHAHALPDSPRDSTHTCTRKTPTTSAARVDPGPPWSPTGPADSLLPLLSGGSPCPCPCPTCDLRPGGPGWTQFSTLLPGPRKFPTTSMRKYAESYATARMHARVHHAAQVRSRLVTLATFVAGVLLGSLFTGWWMRAGVVTSVQTALKRVEGQLVLGAAQVQGTRVAVNQVHARVAAQGTWVKAEVQEVRMQVKQLAYVLQAYHKAVVEAGGGAGRAGRGTQEHVVATGVVERLGQLMKKADEFLGRAGGAGAAQGHTEDERHSIGREDKVQEEGKDEAMTVEDVVVEGGASEAVPTAEEPQEVTQGLPTETSADETVAHDTLPASQPNANPASTDWASWNGQIHRDPDTDDANDNPHAIAESPMSVLVRSLVHVARRIGRHTRMLVLATVHAWRGVRASTEAWGVAAKTRLDSWVEKSRAAKARRAHSVPVSASVHVQHKDPERRTVEDGHQPTATTVADAEDPSSSDNKDDKHLGASPVGSMQTEQGDGHALHVHMLHEKLRQAQEYLRSVERQEPTEDRVMDKWERIQWANRMSAAKDTVRVAREDLERQVGPVAASSDRF